MFSDIASTIIFMSKSFQKLIKEFHFMMYFFNLLFKKFFIHLVYCLFILLLVYLNCISMHLRLQEKNYGILFHQNYHCLGFNTYYWYLHFIQMNVESMEQDQKPFISSIMVFMVVVIHTLELVILNNLIIYTLVLLIQHYYLMCWVCLCLKFKLIQVCILVLTEVAKDPYPT